MTVATRDTFLTTGLVRQTYIDMACFVPTEPARPYLEGLNAFQTEAVFSDAVLRTWLMDLFKSNDRFNFVSRTFIRDNLRTVLARNNLQAQFQNNETAGTPAYHARQREIERNLAMRVARLHNGGNAFRLNIEELLQPQYDLGSYVQGFLGNRGNWNSLRCGTTAGNQNNTWRGLEISPLIL